MPRGQPDFGMYAAEPYLAGLSDMSELAVRLGSIVIFDRRGRIVCLDDFEGTVLKWEGIAVAGGTAVLDSTYPKSGSQGVKLNLSGVAGADIYLYKGFAPLLSYRAGAEISFVRPDSNSYFYCTLVRFDGTDLHRGRIRVDRNGGALAYEDSGGIYREFATGLIISGDGYTHHTLKLVVDFDTDKYVRCYYSHVEYDLSAHGLRVTGDGTAPTIRAEYHLEYRVIAAQSIYLDDFILTQGEP